MYKKILVPLDGSEFSECSLEHVKTIATGCHVPEVVLLRVVEAPKQPLFEVELIAGAMEKGQAEAEDYLSKVANTLKKDGVAAETTVIRGVAAHDILDYADKNQVDLIIMSTHGQSGITRWLFGSVADRVLRHSAVPVLTVSPPGCRQ